MAATTEATSLFEALEAYPWSTDPDYQSGLRAILGNSTQGPESQAQDLTLRARCFYYARKHDAEVDFDGYVSWRAQQPPSNLSSLEMASPAPFPGPLDGESSAESTPMKGTRDIGVAGRRLSQAISNGSAAAQAQTSEQVQSQAVAAREETSSSETTADQTPSFAEIMELIKSGKPIPGIKDIPDTVLVGQGTEPTKARRQKPWERPRTEQQESLFASQTS